MSAQIFLLLLVALNVNSHTVTIECPGVSCRSRFSESLEKNIVQSNDWVHSVSISYVSGHDQEEKGAVWGDTAQLKFTIDRNRQPRELTEILVNSGYYHGTDNWTLVERTAFSKLKKKKITTDETVALGIKVPDKVAEVFWSVQDEVCTVQISFPSLPDGENQPEHPSTQVWLLRADGTAIARVQEPRTLGTSMAGHTTESEIYSYPKSAEDDAVAVVVNIDGDLFTKPLR